MRISRFQLKLTLIFLIVVFVSAMATNYLTRYILTLHQAGGIDVDKKMELVLQGAREIAYDMIEEAALECQSIAEEISDDQEFGDSLDSTQKLANLISGIIPVGGHISVRVIDYRNDPAEGEICFPTSENTEDISHFVTDSLKQQKAPLSYQEGGIVYGAAPAFESENLIAAVIAHQELKPELARNIIDLQKLLTSQTLSDEFAKLLSVGSVIVLLVVLSICGIMVAALIARNVTKPILNLVAGTREVAKGNLDHRIETKGKDEIASLIQSFNHMTSQLKASREKLMRAERLAAWREIARRIAHEIKNPLTPIQLSMYRLRKNLGSEKYEQIFNQSYTSITSEVENLKNMVTEFSDFARMPKPRMRSASPREIVQDAINLYTGLPDNIDLRVDLANDAPQVMVDVDQIRQVLHNLIGNAVEAMSDGGRLSVRMRSEGDNTVVIEISDTGCGMSEEVKEKLFTPYFTTKETGTGLGMAITAQIIEEHQGEILVDSAEDVGTTVTVKLKTIMDNEAAAEEQAQ